MSEIPDDETVVDVDEDYGDTTPETLVAVPVVQDDPYGPGTVQDPEATDDQK